MLKSLRSIQTYLTKENVSAEVQEEEKFLKWDFCIAKPKYRSVRGLKKKKNVSVVNTDESNFN